MGDCEESTAVRRGYTGCLMPSSSFTPAFAYFRTDKLTFSNLSSLLTFPAPIHSVPVRQIAHQQTNNEVERQYTGDILSQGNVVRYSHVVYSSPFCSSTSPVSASLSPTSTENTLKPAYIDTVHLNIFTVHTNIFATRHTSRVSNTSVD